MKTLRSLALIFIAVFGLTLVAPSIATAIDVLPPQVCNNKNATEQVSVCQDESKGNDNPFFGPSGVITKAIMIFSYVAGITAVIVIIVAGIRYITSMGDPNAVNAAKNAILYAIIGLAVFASAQLIVNFVLKKL